VGLAHQDDSAIGADGKKACMPGGNLAGMAHQQIEADDDNHIDGHIIGHVDIIIFKQKGKEGQKNNEGTEPKDDHTGCEQLHVFIIVPFHIHGKTITITS
jgi:hypothetical protein